MKPEMEAVVRLQSLDDRAADLRKEIAALPKHVAEIERKLEGHIRQLEADRATLAASQKKRKSLEDDIKVCESKISKLKDQMLQAKTNEQYRAFQNEIAFNETSIRNAEDQILEQMELGEPLEGAVKTAEAALAAEKKSVEAEKERARQRSAESEAELKKVMTEREELARSIPVQLLNHYERSRKRWHTSGISDATSGRCAACNIALRPQFFQELKAGEKVLSCESCGRLLYYNPPVAFEHEMHQKL